MTEPDPTQESPPIKTVSVGLFLMRVVLRLPKPCDRRTGNQKSPSTTQAHHRIRTVNIRMMTTIRAVIFDLDDTLTHRRAMLESYASLFLTAFRPYLQVSDLAMLVEHLASAERHGYNPRRVDDTLLLPIWNSRPDRVAVDRHWAEHFPLCTVLRTGCLETLRRLRTAGFLVGIVTNGGSHSQRTKIRVSGLNELADAIVISQEVDIKKPHPDIFKYALGKLDVSPHECVFVGDNPMNDVKGAADFGMHAVWLKAALPWPSELAPPEFEVASVEEVTMLLNVPR